jgi:hypothetical protein
MFEHGGELALFREIGLNPIFFGEVVAGKRMPCMMYMVGSSSLEKHREAWRTFGSHPTWRELRNDPEYKDTATDNENVVVTPSPGSQV